MTPLTWVLSDGRPGHFNQSLGLLSALPADLAAHRLVTLPPPRKIVKNIALLLAAFAGPALARALFRLYYGSEPPPAQDCRLLVSTGGDTLVANLLLARLSGKPNVFIGKRSRITDRGIALVFASSGRAVPGRVVVLDFGPVNMPSLASNSKEKSNTIAVLIGGNSTEYAYTETDYLALAGALNTLCARTGLRLLLTTSRRTGLHGEAILREHINTAHITEATWYNTAPQPVTRDYCTRADAILCSEDSGTMLTESIQFGKPVIGYHPAQRHTTAFYNNFLDKLRGHRVVFTGINGIATIDPQALPPAVPVDITPVSTALHALLKR